ncbi:MAG TPA: YdcH family protein [Vicinamibacterales bacterium]|nr:YdcH family protein [Vicinamibacterales bacterium]
MHEQLRELLLRTDGEFHQLADRHHELEGRLHELTGKPYLSDPEQVEEANLKKEKLRVKDQMEGILRHRAQPH